MLCHVTQRHHVSNMLQCQPGHKCAGWLHCCARLLEAGGLLCHAVRQCDKPQHHTAGLAAAAGAAEAPALCSCGDCPDHFCLDDAGLDKILGSILKRCKSGMPAEMVVADTCRMPFCSVVLYVSRMTIRAVQVLICAGATGAAGAAGATLFWHVMVGVLPLSLQPGAVAKTCKHVVQTVRLGVCGILVWQPCTRWLFIPVRGTLLELSTTLCLSGPCSLYSHICMGREVLHSLLHCNLR
ncbi:hypothetical protein COO60DRAFT_774985 [Scenedesmus sp. NREL 46B-D3]|nr:hypothetical protein COO60DRAFT_774985 [Scenedesmus sp. NREL 46B-D3]